MAAGRGEPPMNLAHLTYEQLELALRDEPDEQLIEMLDERSVKIGDTASSILSRRGKHQLLLELALKGEFRTRNGKIRAMNTLGLQGRKLPASLDVYLKFLCDRNAEVAGNALFFIVLWNDKSQINAVRSCQNTALSEKIDQAIAALEAGDYRIYSPYFWDNTNIWS